MQLSEGSEYLCEVLPFLLQRSIFMRFVLLDLDITDMKVLENEH